MPAANDPRSKRLRWYILAALLAIAALVVVVAALIVGGLVSVGFHIYDMASESHAEQFQRRTQLTVPKTIREISAGDDHGGIMGEGVFHFVFESDPDLL